MTHPADPTSATITSFTCPVPVSDHATIQLAHGGGGKLTQRLLEQVFLPAFDNPALAVGHDGALLESPPGRLAFTTDAHVIRPLFFPGGNIGSLAVHGTVNDLLVCGAIPWVMSASFILEEGFEIAQLKAIVEAMKQAAVRCKVQIVTGDTKVVDRGKGDGVFISTSAVGRIHPNVDIRPQRARAGDVVLISGSIASHGIAVLAAREDLGLGGAVTSDSAPLDSLLLPAFERFGSSLHVLRDPTRGGVASALNEIAAASGTHIGLNEEAIPIEEPVHGACELLGLDPLYVANEGKVIAIVASEAAAPLLELWRTLPDGSSAAIIGSVTDDAKGLVTLKSRIGGKRVVDMMTGEQLPRIC
ncbi:MAG TPA: hydrogenase expression/formation protein HypE [Polyangiaceae bacterium]|nr:hydrogenase expression/formation protein HypE [Polyangiaceae bacterium]